LVGTRRRLSSSNQFSTTLICFAETFSSFSLRPDLVVCEFRADHGVNKIWWQILSNTRMSLTHLTFEVKEEGKRISVDVIPRYRRLSHLDSKDIADEVTHEIDGGSHEGR